MSFDLCDEKGKKGNNPEKDHHFDYKSNGIEAN